MAPPLLAELPLSVLLWTVSVALLEEPTFKIAPPLPLVELPLRVLLVIVRDPSPWMIAPPLLYSP
jgi:hypothetical protein